MRPLQAGKLYQSNLAEGEGFEPPRLITWLFSRQLPSTARPSLQAAKFMAVGTPRSTPGSNLRDTAHVRHQHIRHLNAPVRALIVFPDSGQTASDSQPRR